MTNQSGRNRPYSGKPHNPRFQQMLDCLLAKQSHTCYYCSRPITTVYALREQYPHLTITYNNNLATVGAAQFDLACIFIPAGKEDERTAARLPLVVLSCRKCKKSRPRRSGLRTDHIMRLILKMP